MPARADRQTRAIDPAPAGTALEDRWIRSRLATELDGIVGHLERYDFSAAVKQLYAFVWNDFCDWYVEAVKPRLRGEERAEASANLLWMLEQILALTHPICPFVTEAIWSNLPGERELLMLAPMPIADESHRDPAAEADMERAIEIVTAARADPGGAVEVADGFAGAGIVERLTPKRARDGQAPDRAALERELAKLRSELDRAEGMLRNARFTSKAPREVVAAEREKAERFAADVRALESRLAALE